MSHIPLLYLPDPMVKRLWPVLLGISSRIEAIVPGLHYDVEQSDIESTPAEYVATVLANTFAFFTFFFTFLFFLNYFATERNLQESAVLSLGLGVIVFLLLTVVLLRYPKIMAGKKAEQINKHLVFALKDLLLQVGAGVSLYNGLVSVSKSDYGQVSIEFEKVAQNVSTGMSMIDALEKMAIGSNSNFLRRTTWQLINTLKAGASVKSALRTIVNDLSNEQRSKISDYARELNLYTLVYMIFSVAVPTIGSVMLVILSSFAGFGISRNIFLGFMVINVIIQYVIVGFVKSRRPMVVV